MTGAVLEREPVENGSTGPTLVTAVTSPSDSLSGWVVVDSLAESMDMGGTMAMGGTRMTASVTEQEVRDLAAAMTTKLALAGLPIGGAKAGIRAVPGERDRVLRAFGRSVAPLLHGGVYLGCDLGTTHADRDVFLAEARFDVLKSTRASQLPTDWTDFWTYMVDITGYGVSAGALTALEVLRTSSGSGEPRTVALQGFGTVGRSVAKTLESRGHRIVAVADVQGTVYAPEGLPVKDLLAVTDTAGTLDRSRLPASVQVMDGPEAWLDAEADVLVLAAGGDALRGDNVHRVRAGIVVEGGNLCCTRDAKASLAASGTLLVPDVVANVGGAAVTGCVMTGTVPFDLPLTQMVAWLFDWVEGRVRENTKDVLEIAASGSSDPVGELLAARRRTARW